MVSSAFNLASATCGAGVLALPYAMVHSGLLVGTVTVLGVCGFTIYSVYLLTEISTLTDLSTYEELALDLVGPTTEKVTAVIIVVFCWGVAVMYIVVMGDILMPLTEMLGIEEVVGRRTAMIAFWATVMFPLSLARRINTLRYASIVGTVSTVLVAVALFCQFVVSPGKDTGVLKGAALAAQQAPLARWDSHTIGALATFVFSYGCQPVAPKIYQEMADRSVRRMSLCVTYSMSVCTLLYIATGLLGAICFGDAAQPNILTNFGKHLNTVYAQLAYLGMAIGVTMAFPMTIFPTRDSVMMALGYRTEESPAPGWLSSTVAGLLALLALLIGIVVPNIRVLFDVLGGVCGGSLSFLLPGLFAIRSEYWSVSRVGWGHVTAAWITMLFGAVVCLLGTYNSIYTNFLA